MRLVSPGGIPIHLSFQSGEFSPSGYCPKCNANRELLIKAVDETYLVRGKMVAIKTEVTFCAHYGEDVFDPDLDSANLERVLCRIPPPKRFDVP